MKLGRYFGVNNNVEGLPRAAGRARWVTRVLKGAEASKERSVRLDSPYLEGLRKSVQALDERQETGDR